MGYPRWRGSPCAPTCRKQAGSARNARHGATDSPRAWPAKHQGFVAREKNILLHKLCVIATLVLKIDTINDNVTEIRVCVHDTHLSLYACCVSHTQKYATRNKYFQTHQQNKTTLFFTTCTNFVTTEAILCDIRRKKLISEIKKLPTTRVPPNGPHERGGNAHGTRAALGRCHPLPNPQLACQKEIEGRASQRRPP